MKSTECTINSNVWVKLNAIGRAMWKQHHALSGKKAPELTSDAEGWTSFKLHKLMHVFGPGCFQGADLPFALTIRIEKTD
jgi:hypothetical protein